MAELPAIPLEVQFLILDQLYAGRPVAAGSALKNKPNLKPLALTCLAWASHIQSLLFRRISLDLKNTTAFLALLRTNSRLGAHPLVVVVPGSASAVVYAQIQHLLPNVHTFRIHSHIFEPLPEACRPWPKVHTLALGYCIVSTARDLWAFLALFPALEHLRCWGWHYALDQDDESSLLTQEQQQQPPLHLKRLTLTSSETHSPQYIGLQLAAREGFRVDAFTVTFAAEDDRERAVNALLVRIGPTLQELRVVDIRAASDSDTQLDITACTALRHLSLALPDILPLLRQVSAAAALLASVTLSIGASAAAEDENWEDVDALLGGPAFRRLERVVLRVIVAKDEGEEKARASFAEVRGRMGRMGARGLLKFEVGELAGAGV
ncbi:hypothetical protein C8R46DRAFT_1065204 [Mycena filopes]|nr:hypothetical protein C8R46DRAFT_1065204 [Mycena filopes]